MDFLWLSIQLGILSSQLTHIFQRGRLKPPTTNQSFIGQHPWSNVVVSRRLEDLEEDVRSGTSNVTRQTGHIFLVDSEENTKLTGWRTADFNNLPPSPKFQSSGLSARIFWVGLEPICWTIRADFKRQPSGRRHVAGSARSLKVQVKEKEEQPRWASDFVIFWTWGDHQNLNRFTF